MHQYRLKVFSIILIATSIHKAHSEKFCSLQPDHFDGKRKSIQEFEQNIEHTISSIYQKEYPQLKEKLEQLEKQSQQLTRFIYSVANSHVRIPRKHHKNPHIRKQKLKKYRQDFVHLIEQDIKTEKEWEFTLQNTSTIKPFSFELYRSYVTQVHQMQADIESLNNVISPMRALHLLYTPKVDYFIRNKGISYGNLQLEAFFRPPKDDLFKLPFLNIGFETNNNTIIYTCIHLDAVDSSKNLLYIYFLSTTKLYSFQWKDLILEPNLVIRSLLTWRRPPQALIAPLPFQLNPTAKVVDIVTQANKQISAISKISIMSDISNIINKLQIIDITTQIHPALKFILSNVDFGIKGVLIRPDQLQIRYAGSVLYGLINFNLAKHSQQADFSEFMNILTWNEESIEDDSE